MVNTMQLVVGLLCGNMLTERQLFSKNILVAVPITGRETQVQLSKTWCPLMRIIATGRHGNVLLNCFFFLPRSKINCFLNIKELLIFQATKPNAMYTCPSVFWNCCYCNDNREGLCCCCCHVLLVTHY